MESDLRHSSGSGMQVVLEEHRNLGLSDAKFFSYRKQLMTRIHAIAQRNRCDYCLAAHSTLSKMVGLTHYFNHVANPDIDFPRATPLSLDGEACKVGEACCDSHK